VPGDGLPEAVARGVSARGCQCRQWCRFSTTSSGACTREAPRHGPGSASSFYGGEFLAPSLPYRPTPSLLDRHTRSVPGEVSPVRVCIVIVRRRAYGACGFFFFPLSYLWLSVFHDYLGLSKTKCADCDFVVCSNCIWLQN
jgi:hypothetical protein